MTWKQKADVGAWLLSFPALTVMIFLRGKTGFRQLKPGRLVVMWFLLLMLATFGGMDSFSSLASFDGSNTSKALALFAWAMLIFGVVQRRMRWNDLKSGVRLHTYARGVPWLAKFVPLSENIVQRFIDPAVCFLFGLVVLLLSRPLGMWLIFSGLALYMVEQYVYEKQLEQHLDTLDGLVDSEVQGENVQHFEGAQPEQKQRSLEETAGIPTGIAPELEVQIQKRRKRKPPADDLG